MVTVSLWPQLDEVTVPVWPQVDDVTCEYLSLTPVAGGVSLEPHPPLVVEDGSVDPHPPAAPPQSLEGEVGVTVATASPPPPQPLPDVGEVRVAGEALDQALMPEILSSGVDTSILQHCKKIAPITYTTFIRDAMFKLRTNYLGLQKNTPDGILPTSIWMA